MEEEIKILEAIIEECRVPHFKLDFMDIQALRNTLDRLKEDEAVIYYMIEDIRKRSIDCVYSHEELEKIYRNKVKELGWLDE